MGFADAVKKGFDNITNFEGRSSRSEFWWFVLALWIVNIVVDALIYAVFNGFIENLLLGIVWVIITLGYLSVGIRRLHDVGQSGWMIIFAFLCCLVIIPIIFWVQPSQQGDNQYGPQPA